ncbi:hypothetical protein OIU74_007249 [Salix koriyanagi]|uniref:Uncharacterized protein n=1 Tax=Salix koriyanagi TaxID=2511006 RepID=A0A9Q0U365_9ROSI|nr:hypothetical protein OIU74_007249 [Salix koriyanagi]
MAQTIEDVPTTSLPTRKGLAKGKNYTSCIESAVKTPLYKDLEEDLKRSESIRTNAREDLGRVVGLMQGRILRTSQWNSVLGVIRT